ncbi:MAG: preprotein translocase subunit SecE [Planctomycetota bacterium]
MASAEPIKKNEDGGGLLRVYKPGRGYWTRLCTGLGAALVIVLFSFWFLNLELNRFEYFRTNNAVRYGVLGAVAALLALVTWWFINRPKNAEFLIETDGEMKKVNWTSRKELVGSTQVVVIFMFFIAIILFFFDIFFGFLFHWIGILEAPPFTFD